MHFTCAVVGKLANARQNKFFCGNHVGRYNTLRKLYRHSLAEITAQQIDIVYDKRIQFSRRKCKQLARIIEFIPKQLADNRLHVLVFHADFTPDNAYAVVTVTPEFMRIYRFFYGNSIEIVAFTQVGKSSNATGLCICIYRIGENKTRRFKPCFIFLFVARKPERIFEVTCDRE